MYCRHCGKTIADDSRFCKFCGKNVEEPQIIAEQKSLLEEKQAKSKKKKNLWPNGILVLLVIIVAIGVIATIIIVEEGKNNSSSSSNSYEESNSTDISGNFESVKIRDLTATRNEILPYDIIKISIKFEEYHSEIKTTWYCTGGNFTNQNNH